MSLLPQVPFGPHMVSRLIVGGNPFKGFSHHTREMDEAMRAYYTEGRMVEVLLACQEVGITAMQSRGDREMMNMIRAYREAGGTMQWIAQTASEWGDAGENIRAIAELKPVAIYHHGTNTDRHFKEKTMEAIRPRIELIKELGFMAGVGSHIPEALAFVEGRGWPVDFYMCSLYNLSKELHESPVITGWVGEDHLFTDSDRYPMTAFVRQTSKPCLVFKVLASGRKCRSQKDVRQAFGFVLERIKPTDAMVVGMFPKRTDQVRLNAEHLRALCES
jgi:hypothetical protein